VGDNSWDEIIAKYQYYKKQENWEFLADLELLVQHILQNRDVSAVHPFASHVTLCLTKYKTYDEWHDKPFISIDSTHTGKYKFTLTEPLEDGEVYRARSESIVCSFDKTLDIYDELIEKLTQLEA